MYGLILTDPIVSTLWMPTERITYPQDMRYKLRVYTACAI